jgi:hypothetical protein
MNLPFKPITTVVSILAFLLCITLLFAPSLLAWLFQIEQTNSSDFMGRRAAMLFLGFGTLAVLTRNTRIRDTQRIVATTFFVLMAGLACLGLYEFFIGNVGVGIFVAIATEILICLAYAPLIRAPR